jgi:hypothetical protein
MLAAGSESGAVNKYFNGAFKRDMGRLAASYPQEMLSSGNGLNQDITDSLLGVPTDYTSIPGINPSFVLSGSDAYKFLKTFAGSDSYSAPYDEVMGSLQQGTLVKCARADSQALRAGKQDPENYENAAEAFGNIQRLQYDSEMKIRGDMDASDEANREALKRLVFLGTELAGEPEMGFAAKVSWRTGMWAVKEFGGDAFVDWGPERTEGVEDRNYEMLAQTRYTMTSTLLEGGWKATTPLPEDLRGPDGKLASFEELARDGKLQDFDDWVNEQRGGAVSLQQKQAHASGLMDTAQADGVAHAVDSG